MAYGLSVENDTPADVAELVDALVSGTSGSNVVGVQVSPSALSCWSQAPTTDHDCSEDLQLIGGGGFQGRKVFGISYA